MTSTPSRAVFNPPPNWPTPPAGWQPPSGWVPDPSWGPAPYGWQLWVDAPTSAIPTTVSAQTVGPASAHSATHAVPAPPVSPAGPQLTPWPTAPHRPLDNTFAWAIAVAPLSFILLDVLLLQFGTAPDGWVGFLLALVINTVLVTQDRRRLTAAGIAAPSIWAALLLVPLYLIQRSRRTGSHVAIPMVWGAAFLAYLVSFPISSALGGVQLDDAYLETEIASWAQSQSGMATTVSCPDDPIVRVGGTLTCTGTDATGSAQILVTVNNSAGDVTWIITG